MPPQSTTIAPLNPSGLCMCGCGEQAPIAPTSNRRVGYVAGQPRRFVHNHHGRKAVVDVDATSGCWNWTGATCHGYGKLMRDGVTHLAHRYYYEQRHGPVPSGHHVHHRCENPLCVNPDHLEPLLPLAHGQRHAESLTAEDVVVIKHLALTQSRRTIAQQFNVSAVHITNIVNGKKWGVVT